MIRRPSAVQRPLLAALSVLACLAALACGCSGSSSSSPAGSTGGPALGFTFPATGVSHQFQFTTAGSWDYHCLPHQSAGMTGTVVVDPSSTVDSVHVLVGPGNTLTFSPATATIKPNGFIRWENMSTMTIHTVTRP